MSQLSVATVRNNLVKSFSDIPLLGWFLLLFSAVLLTNVLQSVYIAYKPGLRRVPGPTLARFTKFWRPWKISKGDAPQLYIRLHEKYGDIVRTGPNTVDISNPESLPVIYGINSKFLKSAFYDVFSPTYQDKVMPSMFTVRDPAHHQALRRPVAQKFSMSSIKAFEPFADECASIFVEAMRDMEGQVVDLGVWLQYYAFDVIGAITFQRRFGFMEKRQDIEHMIGDLEKGLVYGGIISQVPEFHRFLLGSLFLTGLMKSQPFFRVPDPLRTIVNFTQTCIDDYDKGSAMMNAERPDFLAWLRAEEKKGRPMSDRDIMNHLSNNLVAGSDTTAISLRAVIYYLVQTPHSYRKLQEEIDAADRAGKLSQNITFAESLELPYLQAVMKEAMRCHPGVSFPLERVVPKGGINICNVHLEAGTIVGINPAVMHLNKSIFGEDAGEFRPERWTKGDKEQVKRMDQHLMTFGYGSRTCIGKNISIMEMGKLIPQLFRQFEIEWAADEPEWRVETFWFAKQFNLKCRLTSRKR